MPAMTSRPTDTRTRLHEAALRVIARSGAGASVRTIAKAAGVTEGALYRHYPSREHLLGAVFAELIEPMIAEKEALVAMRAPIGDRLREWVRCTYARFDRSPDGFAYIFLTDHDIPKEFARLSGRQSVLLRALIAQGQDEGSLRDLPESLAATLMIGQLLSVPAAIYRGSLSKPAMQYVDEVADAIWRSLGVD